MESTLRLPGFRLLGEVNVSDNEADWGRRHEVPLLSFFDPVILLTQPLSVHWKTGDEEVPGRNVPAKSRTAIMVCAILDGLLRRPLSACTPWFGDLTNDETGNPHS